MKQKETRSQKATGFNKIARATKVEWEWYSIYWLYYGDGEYLGDINAAMIKRLKG